ncbi:hypothetical protein CPHO_01160 [Corynebacterium phocae]|uniref:Oxidoreductase n=1 Tax=Corynebacterium phocae TaxID=161895 RepID=A0A1L7D0Z4_9CORY|nr:hypothetical protein [Corynebacterium phocae]APT91760.1 hypothetical protein CPHO_01160 [Corynebacterium phocae]
MHDNDPFAPFLALPGVAESAQLAVESINRAHRCPAALRQADVISAESLLRGARVTAPDIRITAGAETSAYSLLAPELLTTTVRSYARAPLNFLARVDVAAGGPGTPAAAHTESTRAGRAHSESPHSESPHTESAHTESTRAESPHSGRANAERARAIARLVTGYSGATYDRLAPVLVHAEIAAFQVFGPRSELVARVAARATASHTGFDPRCLAVPETYLNRHASEYQQALRRYANGQPTDLLVVLFRAWEAGGVEAEGIARAM